MEKEELVVLVADNQSEFKELNAEEILGSLEHEKVEVIDIILIESGDKNVKIILRKTKRTDMKHDGHWRYIFQQQGDTHKNEDGEIFFTFFHIENTNTKNVLTRISNFFNLNLKS